MKSGSRVVLKFCGCGCGNTVPPRYDQNGRHRGYNKCLPGHKRPQTIPQKVAWKISRAKRHQPIGTKRLQSSGLGRPSYYVVKVAEGGRWPLEHRWLVEQHLGRKLKTNEHVHHINGNTLDNRLENLQLLSASDHTRIAGLENVKQHKGIFQYPMCLVCGWRHPPHH